MPPALNTGVSWAGKFADRPLVGNAIFLSRSPPATRQYSGLPSLSCLASPHALLRTCLPPCVDMSVALTSDQRVTRTKHSNFRGSTTRPESRAAGAYLVFSMRFSTGESASRVVGPSGVCMWSLLRGHRIRLSIYGECLVFVPSWLLHCNQGLQHILSKASTLHYSTLNHPDPVFLQGALCIVLGGSGSPALALLEV